MNKNLLSQLTRVSFWLGALRNFVNKDGIDAVTVLAYTSLLGIVPFLAMIISVLSVTDFFKAKTNEVLDLVLAHVLPSSSPVIEKYFIEFSGHASNLKGMGIAFIFLTSILLLWSIDTKINAMWDKRLKRRFWVSLLHYLSISLVGPLLLVGSLFLSSILMAYPLSFLTGYQAVLLDGLPFVINLFGFWFLYHYVPIVKVKSAAAFIGGLFAALEMEVLKEGFAVYVKWFPTYDLVYGVFSVIPLFLLWLYLVWMIVIFNASIVRQLDKSLKTSNNMEENR
ncbi:MAG: YihY family inner membrane protein [Hydrogenovibrio sp.]|nr:YihY family inner membrane protein [Hydrogenovibrio sp.]